MEKKESKVLPLLSLLFGIASLLSSCFLFISLSLAVASIVLAIISFVKKKPVPMPIIGLLCSFGGIIATIIISLVGTTLNVALGLNGIVESAKDASEKTLSTIEEEEDIFNKLEGYNITTEVENNVVENNVVENNIVENNIVENNNVENKEELSLLEACVNGITIKFPATKENFANTGWTWNENYANKMIDSGYTTSGGRIGSYPGGVVVSVVNNSNEIKKIQDCTIDDATFYNPKDGSSNVTFIGGINYNSTESEVKSTMDLLGYKNVKISNYDTSSYYTYFLNDDQNEYKNKIEFNFYNGVISSISIYTAGY